MTKLEELKAAIDAARAVADVAWFDYRAELKKHERTLMTKLEELEAAIDAARAAFYAADAAYDDACDAYQAELNKTQEENTDGH